MLLHVRHTSWCLMVAVVLSQVVAHNEELRRHNRHIGPSMLIGAAGLAAVAETARPIEEPLANGRGRQEQHSMRIKRSDIEFEIDEAMVLRVAAMDESGCGARLLCELHQEEPAQLNGTIARRLVQIFESVETNVKLFHHFNDYDYDCYFLFFQWPATTEFRGTPHRTESSVPVRRIRGGNFWQKFENLSQCVRSMPVQRQDHPRSVEQ